jgi:protein-S-isoprenylcysteine O-methyltransferase Ste14
MNLKLLVGSGDKIGLLVLPFLIVGLALAILIPPSIALPQSDAVRVVGIVLLVPGIVIWAWSAVLILTNVPRRKLITGGPFRLVKHPLYTGVALLVLPGLGLILGTWLGIAFGIILYAASRAFSPEEERTLSKEFGAAWDEYAESVLLPWL